MPGSKGFISINKIRRDIMGNVQLGERLRALRESHNYTQKYISNHFNIERSSYSNYERGKRTPPLELLVNLADFYHVSTDYLLSGEDDLTTAAAKEETAFTVTKDEQRLLILYRQLNHTGKRATLEYLEAQSERNPK
jgi:transcriptional regulator with XRE-family HTH domain